MHHDAANVALNAPTNISCPVLQPALDASGAPVAVTLHHHHRALASAVVLDQCLCVKYHVVQLHLLDPTDHGAEEPLGGGGVQYHVLYSQCPAVHILEDHGEDFVASDVHEDNLDPASDAPDEAGHLLGRHAGVGHVVEAERVHGGQEAAGGEGGGAGHPRHGGGDPVQTPGDGGRLVGEDLLGQVAGPYWDYSSLNEVMTS